MWNVLTALQKTQTRVSIHFYQSDPNKFMYGEILAVDPEDTVVQEYTPAGEYCGISLVKTDSIVRVETNTEYDACMGRLISQPPKHPMADALRPGSLVTSVLHWAKDAHRIVSVELQDSGYMDVEGFVESLEENIGCIRSIDHYGEEDGDSYFRISDVTLITLESSTQTRLQRLADSNKR